MRDIKSWRVKMLNEVVLMGRLTSDAETKFLQSNNSSVTRFTLAVERDFKAGGEERPKADFINCIAWNKTGEFIQKYFAKGNMIAVTGRIETGSYTGQDGKKVYTTEVNVSKASFTGEKSGSSQENAGSSQEPPIPTPSDIGDGFMNIPDGIDEELPFT